MVMSSSAPCARSAVSFCGWAWVRSMPASCITRRTSGWIRGAGLVPAEIASACVGSARALKNAAAIWDRPALWMQAKIYLRMMDEDVRRSCLQWEEPAEEECGGCCPGELGEEKYWYV